MYDTIIKDALVKILNIQLPEKAWSQATLPVAKSRLGLRPATEVALAGYLSSAHSSSGIVQSLLPDSLRGRKCKPNPILIPLLSDESLSVKFVCTCFGECIWLFLCRHSDLLLVFWLSHCNLSGMLCMFPYFDWQFLVSSLVAHEMGHHINCKGPR